MMPEWHFLNYFLVFLLFLLFLFSRCFLLSHLVKRNSRRIRIRSEREDGVRVWYHGTSGAVSAKRKWESVGARDATWRHFSTQPLALHATLSLSLSLALFSEEEEEEEILRKGFPVVVVVVVVVVLFFFLFLLARLPAFQVFLTFDLTLSFFFCSSPSLSFSLSLSLSLSLCYPNQMLC